MSRDWWSCQILRTTPPWVVTSHRGYCSASPQVPRFPPQALPSKYRASLGLGEGERGKMRRRLCICLKPLSMHLVDMVVLIWQGRLTGQALPRQQAPAQLWYHPTLPSLSVASVSTVPTPQVLLPATGSILTCFAFNSSSIANSWRCKRLNLLILSWSSRRTSTSSPIASSSSLVNCAVNCQQRFEVWGLSGNCWPFADLCSSSWSSPRPRGSSSVRMTVLEVRAVVVWAAVSWRGSEGNSRIWTLTLGWGQGSWRAPQTRPSRLLSSHRAASHCQWSKVTPWSIYWKPSKYPHVKRTSTLRSTILLAIQDAWTKALPPRDGQKDRQGSL
jgi:hypothetical protein